MDLKTKCTSKEIELIENVGITIDNRDYNKDDLRKIENRIVEYIMSHSSKNGDIDSLKNQYESIFRILVDRKD